VVVEFRIRRSEYMVLLGHYNFIFVCISIDV
jgi:hypothetical protein